MTLSKPVASRRARSSMMLLMATVALILTSSSPVLGAQRVRKELRELSTQELQLFYQGLFTMISVPSDLGQTIFGPAYREYDYFIVKHALSAHDPRGDQGHSGPCFLTFHRALLLEFEAALLSVVPDLGAMPYWDLLRDVRGGMYPPQDMRSIFSTMYAGSLNTSASANFTVTNSPFAWRLVRSYPFWMISMLRGTTGENIINALLANRTVDSNHRYVRRYGFKLIVDSERQQGLGRRYVNNTRPDELPLNYTRADWELCLDPVLIRTVQDWFCCVDGLCLVCEPGADCPATPVVRQVVGMTNSAMLHPGPHTMIGGALDPFTRGDFMQVATSPDEVLLFMLHHANVDRSALIWQIAAANTNANLANVDVLWNFARASETAPKYFPSGCYLDDTLSSMGPFTNILPGIPPHDPQGYTHREIMWYTRPEVIPYTYDDMRGAGGTRRSSS